LAIIAATTTFGAVPCQMVSSGAMATMGVTRMMFRYGYGSSSVSGDRAMRMPRRNPASAAMRKPETDSTAVTWSPSR
jgi:hypothetical protein